MKSLLAFAKDSAKKSFQKLREEEFFYSHELDKKIYITKQFFNHVVSDKNKKRTAYEIMERILIFPFLHEIITGGILVKSQSDKFSQFFRISKKYNKYILTIIILYDKKRAKYILLSCFKNYKKKNLSLVPLQ